MLAVPHTVGVDVDELLPTGVLLTEYVGEMDADTLILKVAHELGDELEDSDTVEQEEGVLLSVGDSVALTVPDTLIDNVPV